MKKRLLSICLLSAVTALIPNGAILANEDRKVPAAKVVWQLVGKTLIDPLTGDGQVLGYFTFIEGVGGPMFSSQCSRWSF